MLNFDYFFCLVNSSGSCLSKAKYMTSFFLGAQLTVFAHLAVAVSTTETALPAPDISLHLFY